MEIIIGTSIIIFCTFTLIMFCIIMDKLIEIKESIEDFDIRIKNVSESKENESIRS